MLAQEDNPPKKKSQGSAGPASLHIVNYLHCAESIRPDGLAPSSPSLKFVTKPNLLESLSYLFIYYELTKAFWNAIILSNF